MPNINEMEDIPASTSFPLQPYAFDARGRAVLDIEFQTTLQQCMQLIISQHEKHFSNENTKYAG